MGKLSILRTYANAKPPTGPPYFLPSAQDRFRFLRRRYTQQQQQFPTGRELRHLFIHLEGLAVRSSRTITSVIVKQHEFVAAVVSRFGRPDPPVALSSTDGSYCQLSVVGPLEAPGVRNRFIDPVYP